MKLNRHCFKKEYKHKQIHLNDCILLQVLPRTLLSLISCNRHQEGYYESVRLSQSLTWRSRQIAFRFSFSPAYKNLYLVRERTPSDKYLEKISQPLHLVFLSPSATKSSKNSFAKNSPNQATRFWITSLLYYLLIAMVNCGSRHQRLIGRSFDNPIRLLITQAYAIQQRICRITRLHVARASVEHC